MKTSESKGPTIGSWETFFRTSGNFFSQYLTRQSGSFLPLLQFHPLTSKVLHCFSLTEQSYVMRLFQMVDYHKLFYGLSPYFSRIFATNKKLRDDIVTVDPMFISSSILSNNSFKYFFLISYFGIEKQYFRKTLCTQKFNKMYIPLEKSPSGSNLNPFCGSK